MDIREDGVLTEDGAATVEQASLPATGGRPRPTVLLARFWPKPPPGEDARRLQTGRLLYAWCGNSSSIVNSHFVASIGSFA
jgi:hypothetical protein